MQLFFSFFLPQPFRGPQIDMPQRQKHPLQEVVAHQIGVPYAFLGMGEISVRSGRL